ncbi:MAG: hypothetical protein ACYCSN_20265 [Acidobacteriaceae bacterium]
MSVWAAFIQALFPSRFNTSGPNLGSILGAAGSILDSLDPAQTQLAKQFSVSGATGAALDQNGADWGVTRYGGENDSSYRARILAELPTYASGPTLASLSAAVKPFTGVAPTIYSGVQYANLFPLTFPLQFGANKPSDFFTLSVYIQNPNGVSYQRQDVVAAVYGIKRVIAIVTIHWEDGTTTIVQ